MSPSAGSPLISIVIVHFRGSREFRDCVQSCLELPHPVEIVVVDNEGYLSTDWLPSTVHVIRMDRNRGYGIAANRGLNYASGPYKLVLNQDTLLEAAALNEMIEVAELSGAHLVGPRLVDQDGARAPLKRTFPPPLRVKALRQTARWTEVPWICGAAMLFTPRASNLFFDERFFMYVEDQEICYRAWIGDGSVAVAEWTELTHLGGTATRTLWSPIEIALRTHLNRARMLGWHASWAWAIGYMALLFGSRLVDRRSPLLRDSGPDAA